MRGERSCVVFRSPSPTGLAFNTRVARRKRIGLHQKRCFAPGITHSCPLASAVLPHCMECWAGPARPWRDFHLLLHSAIVASFLRPLLLLLQISHRLSAVVFVGHLSELTCSRAPEGTKKENFVRTPHNEKY